jgi:hypothetical protein
VTMFSTASARGGGNVTRASADGPADKAGLPMTGMVVDREAAVTTGEAGDGDPGKLEPHFLSAEGGANDRTASISF